MTNSPIGGFFELELPTPKGCYHSEALALTNGRACISWILEREAPDKVLLPYYCCGALFEPMLKMGIHYEFYRIDENFDPVDLPMPNEGELLIYLNYFGMKNREAMKLSRTLGRKLVIDNTHSFFCRDFEDSYSFTSARKYFGVPDGAYLYAPGEAEVKDIPRFSKPSLKHAVKRLAGEQDVAFRAYQEYEAKLDIDILRISKISERILEGIDYSHVISKRRRNFEILEKALGKKNKLTFHLTSMNAPFCYPFIPSRTLDKCEFHRNAIYVPTLWPDVLGRTQVGYDLELEIAEKLLAFPIDQRYGPAEMNRIIELTNKLLRNE